MATRVGSPYFCCDQLLGGGDEVGEGVALELHLAGVVPGVAELATAADMGVGHDDAAVEQREARWAEADGQRVAVGAIAVDVERVGAVAVEGVAAVDDGDGTLTVLIRAAALSGASIQTRSEA